MPPKLGCFDKGFSTLTKRLDCDKSTSTRTLPPGLSSAEAFALYRGGGGSGRKSSTRRHHRQVVRSREAAGLLMASIRYRPKPQFGAAAAASAKRRASVQNFNTMMELAMKEKEVDSEEEEEEDSEKDEEDEIKQMEEEDDKMTVSDWSEVSSLTDEDSQGKPKNDALAHALNFKTVT